MLLNLISAALTHLYLEREQTTHVIQRQNLQDDRLVSYFQGQALQQSPKTFVAQANQSLQPHRLDVAGPPETTSVATVRSRFDSVGQETTLYSSQVQAVVTVRNKASLARRRPEPISASKRCFCKWDQTTYCWQIRGVLRFISSTPMSHSPSCPLFNLVKQTHRKDIAVYLPRYWGSGIWATFKTTRVSGAYTLSRTLVCRRIVPQNSHIFLLLSPYSSSSTDIQKVREEIWSLLSSGQASPGDVTEDGTTILEVCPTAISVFQI